MFFRRWRLKRLVRKLASESANTPMTGSEPWLAHGLSNGAVVGCESCGRDCKVKLVERTQVVISVAGEMDDYVLVCTECGRLVCHDCAQASELVQPKCDSCGHGAVYPMV